MLLSAAALKVLRQATVLRKANRGVIFPAPATGNALSEVSVSTLLH